MKAPILRGARTRDSQAILRNDSTLSPARVPLVFDLTTFLSIGTVEAMSVCARSGALRHIRRLVITVPATHLKSILASVAFPAFLLGHDPNRAHHLRVATRSVGPLACQRLSRCPRLGQGTGELFPPPSSVRTRTPRPSQDHPGGVSVRNLGWRDFDGPRRKISSSSTILRSRRTLIPSCTRKIDRCIIRRSIRAR